MRILLLLISVLFFSNIAAQTELFAPISYNSTEKALKQSAFNKLRGDTSIQVLMPSLSGIKVTTLYPVDIFADDFKVSTAHGYSPDYIKPVTYHGNLPGGYAALTKTRGHIYASVADQTTHSITHPQGYSYRIDSVPQSFTCHTKDPGNLDLSHITSQSVTTQDDCSPVKMYFEIDYFTYQKFGGVQGAIDDLVSVFNEVAKIYDNEGIPVVIGEIFVWDVPDPYASSTSSGQFLNIFSNRMAAGFPQDLAHLVTRRTGGFGGIAYVDVLCVDNPKYKVAFSGLSSSPPENYPTYSWPVMVIAHEMGHNFGSPHTHNCNWPGGAIDNCFSPEGNCPKGPAPENGGTIMSYCHLTSYGINMANGFGLLPGNRIRSRYNECHDCDSGGGNDDTKDIVVTTSSLIDKLDGAQIDITLAKADLDITETFRTDYYLSKGGVSKDYLIKRTFTPGLSESEAINFQVNWDETNPPAGTYKVIAEIDARDDVSEDDEFNNTHVFPGTVTVEPSNANYCDISGLNNTFEWISGFKIEDTQFTYNRGGYHYEQTPVQVGKSISWKLNIGFSGNSYKEAVRIWIDVDGDKTFEQNELFGKLDNSTEMASGVISTSFDEPTRMRVKIQWTGNQSNLIDDPCGEAEFSDVHDYILTPKDSEEPCEPPVITDMCWQSLSSSIIRWDSNAEVFEVQYRRFEGTWESVRVENTNQVLLENLEGEYEIKVKSGCSSFSDIETFATLPTCAGR